MPESGTSGTAASVLRRARRPLVVLAAAAASALVVLAAVWVTLPGAGGVASRNPRTTALIEQRRAEARRTGHPFRPHLIWVRLDAISPRLVQAVLLSEDARFFGHGAFDIAELRAAVEQDLGRGRFVRGASTLTQQLAKNLFLGTEKTLARKAKEALLAVKLERALTKRRILTLYLNVAEWGDGVFGAEAAAQARFGVSAAELTTAEAAALAAMLPAPRRCDLARPSPWLARRARHVVDLLLESGRIDAAEHAHASAELDRILAGPAAGEPGNEDEPPGDEDDPPGDEDEPGSAMTSGS